MYKKLWIVCLLGLVALGFGGCSKLGSVVEESWGTLPTGEEVMLYTLTNPNGMEVKITNYGGIVVSLTAPDRDGVFEDVVLGYHTLDEYVERNPLFGAIVGLYANRIESGLIDIAGEKVQLFVRDRPGRIPVHMHGGSVGLDEVVWTAKPGRKRKATYVEFYYTHPDGQDGYPGPVQVAVTYVLTHDNALGIYYEAITEKPTVINLTNHSYFNLIGGGVGNVRNHVVQLNADQLTEVKPGLIPTGKYLSVEDTPFDFNIPKRIGLEIDDEFEQLRLGRGYDHNYVLRKSDQNGAELFATVYEPTSGRIMEAYTDQPGVQFYTANGMRGITGKNEVEYGPWSGFCFETQHFPDSPNHSHFPSTLLRPGEVFKSTTVYSFSVE